MSSEKVVSIPDRRKSAKNESRGASFIPTKGLILGSYKLKKKLGEGSLAHVFLAEHITLKRKVALKILKSEALTKKNSVRRFFAEARTVNQIQHKNIVSITDFVEGPPNYFVMEYLEGRTLSTRLFEKGAMNVSEVLTVLRQLGGCLETVHGKGIVHRDLKPANIFLIEEEGRVVQVKLLDFGIAKLVDEIAVEAGVKTSAGALLGTAEYMSPEQAHAIPVDSRTDIYSLGLLAYEMLTGERACGDKRDREALAFAQIGKVAPPSLVCDLPTKSAGALDNFIGRCCEPNPKNRFQTMTEALEVLSQIERLNQKVTVERPKLSHMIGLSFVGLLMLGIGANLIFRSISVNESPVATQEAMVKEAAVKEAFVQLEFLTRPPGATLKQQSTGEILGQTPLQIRVKKSETLTTYTLSKTNFIDHPIKMRPDRSRAFSVQLRLSRPELVIPDISKSKVKVRKKPNSTRRFRKKSRLPLKKNKARKESLKTVDKVETLNPFAND